MIHVAISSEVGIFFNATEGEIAVHSVWRNQEEPTEFLVVFVSIERGNFQRVQSFRISKLTAKKNNIRIIIVLRRRWRTLANISVGVVVIFVAVNCGCGKEEVWIQGLFERHGQLYN